MPQNRLTARFLIFFWSVAISFLLFASTLSAGQGASSTNRQNANRTDGQSVNLTDGQSAPTAEASSIITIFAAGDSTAAPYSEKQAPMKGWVQCLPEFTKERVLVENRAVGGRSTKSFRAEGRWNRILTDMKPGDFVLIQFGHNDQKENRPEIYAEAHTDFKKNLERFVDEVRKKGGKPILITSVTRRVFDSNGNLTFSLKDYPECLRETARKTQTPLVDLNALTRKWVEEAGQEESAGFFMNLQPGVEPNYPNGNRDNSHFHEKGARAVAEMFVKEAQSQGLEIGELFK